MGVADHDGENHVVAIDAKAAEHGAVSHLPERGEQFEEVGEVFGWFGHGVTRLCLNSLLD